VPEGTVTICREAIEAVMGSTPYEPEHLEQLLEIATALSVERNSAHLLERILRGAQRLTRADGGTLYMVEEDTRVRFAILRTDSKGVAMGGTSGTEVGFAPIPLYHEDGTPNTALVVTRAVHDDAIIDIPDTYAETGFDFSGTHEFDRRNGYRTRSLLTVPMKNHEGDIIGVLQLVNARDANGNDIPFSETAKQLGAALASQAAVALTNKRLIDDLGRLFESLIHLIADAIDEKSPYTGGHCRRVPIATMLLAEAVHRTEEGPFAEFRLSEEDRYELEIAAWLHDCGKITTPEHVVDKATKLETIFDRIHLVDARFEVLRRDAEIAMLRRQLAGEPAAATEREYTETLTRLDAAQQFLRRCNLGGEFMTGEDQAEVQRLAQLSWYDRDGTERPLLDEDETRNLTVAKGTLTPEEREIINHHIVATGKMLEALPFPKHLRRVPEYACGHHEKMDGSGYPNGLTREQMSVQARVMAIADVFEALTASDRPYKPGKPLSETLRIMGFMARDGHIDPELFAIFVQQGVYRDYAERYLDPAQRDEVDTAALAGLTLAC